MLRCVALQSIMLMALHGLYQAGLVQWVSSMSYQAVLPPHLPVASLRVRTATLVYSGYPDYSECVVSALEC